LSTRDSCGSCFVTGAYWLRQAERNCETQVHGLCRGGEAVQAHEDTLKGTVVSENAKIGSLRNMLPCRERWLYTKCEAAASSVCLICSGAFCILSYAYSPSLGLRLVRPMLALNHRSTGVMHISWLLNQPWYNCTSICCKRYIHWCICMVIN